MLKVKLVNFDDLTEEEREIQPNNGWGKEYANYIKITDGTETLMILSDSAEPEDATFNRDFKNVIKAIEMAYLKGLKDGKKLNK
ncbi:hypothetical protein [Ectobacillus antri]|uniref:hypothetical protein n=1 Tax=Ectobacillus antri TaxID=2486280 RepID=UPI000F5A86B8|nr:hypothetical protein [Ectobacillus antri]